MISYTEIIAALIGGVVVLGDRYYGHWLSKKKPDLNDVDYIDVLKDILDEVQEELGAYRVSYWAAQNGEKTLDGYSIKKLSMVAESNSPEADNIITTMQNIPAVTFKRNLNLLKLSDGHIYMQEDKQKDSLSKIQRAYGMQSVHSFKVTNLTKRIWSGILVVAFEDKDVDLDDTQKGIVELSIGRIQTVISKL